jgi:hypothetical protein
MVAGLIVVQGMFGAVEGYFSRRAAVGILAVLFLMSLAVEAKHIRPLHAWSIGHGEEKYGRVAAWLNANAPANSAIVAEQFSGATYYFTRFVLIRSNELNDGTAEQVQRALRSERRPVYAVTFPLEQKIMKELPGNWVHVASVEDVTIWRGDWGDPGK